MINPEGEVWCISKHLLAASMRFSEVGTKYLGQGSIEEAKGYFDKSYSLWNLFWGLNLGLIDTSDVTTSGSKEEATLSLQPETKTVSPDPKSVPAQKSNLFGKLGTVIEDIMNCCRE